MLLFTRNKYIILTGILAIGVGVWIRIFRRGPICTSKTDLTGKTVLVTGGNGGVGKETALGLAKRNARVIIACRNAEKASEAVEEIQKISGNDDIKFVLLDLASLEDIRRFAENFLKNEESLDILVNNAAIFNVGKTKDGFELMFGVNQLGPFLLTNLLMPLMQKTSKTGTVRIINVSSEGYKSGKIDFENLAPSSDDSTTILESVYLYSNTKLMNIYFTNELDRRLKDEFSGQFQAITTYSLHPGTVQSDIGKNLSAKMGRHGIILWYFWMSFVAKSTFYGAQTTLCCALDKGIESFSGTYFRNLKPTELWPHATDPEIGKKLWEICEKLTGISIENGIAKA